MIDELVYQYKDHFNYMDFLINIAPIAMENIVYPQEDGAIDSTSVYVEDSADYLPEMEEMFERMGIGKLDGRTGFRMKKDMTYIKCIASCDDKYGRDYGTFYMDVHGTIIIEPEGYDPENDALTAIH